MWYFIQQILKPYKIELTGWLWGGGVYSDWDSLLLKYGGEVFLERRIIFCISILIRCSSSIQSEVIIVICVCTCIIDIIFQVNKLANKVISSFFSFFQKISVFSQISIHFPNFSLSYSRGGDCYQSHPKDNYINRKIILYYI